MSQNNMCMFYDLSNSFGKKKSKFHMPYVRIAP